MPLSSRTKLGLLAALFAALAADAAEAQGLSWSESRQRLQQDQIYRQGTQSQLPFYDLQSLSNDSARIDRLQNSARRDGQPDFSERARIGSALDHQSRAIYNLSHE